MTTAAGDKYANFAAKDQRGADDAGLSCGCGGDSFLVFVFDTLINISLEYLWGHSESANCIQIPSAYAAGDNYANLFQNVLNT